MRSADYGDVALGVECAWPVPGEENGERDVVLRAGDSFRFHRSGLALVEAWTDAALTFSVAD